MSGAVEFHRIAFLDEDSPHAVCAWHALGKGPLPARDPLDADQLAALNAHPLHERNVGAGIEWGSGR